MAVLAKHKGLYCECQGKISHQYGRRTEKTHSAISVWNGCSVWSCLRLVCLDRIVQVDLRVFIKVKEG